MSLSRRSLFALAAGAAVGPMVPAAAEPRFAEFVEVHYGYFINARFWDEMTIGERLSFVRWAQINAASMAAGGPRIDSLGQPQPELADTLGVEGLA